MLDEFSRQLSIFGDASPLEMNEAAQPKISADGLAADPREDGGPGEALAREILDFAAGTRNRSLRKVADHLASVARTDGGFLALSGDRLNYRRLSVAAGVKQHAFIPGEPSRVLIDQFVHRFHLVAVRYSAGGEEKPETILDKIRKFLATGELVPSRGSNLISLRGVAERIGVPYAAIAEYADAARIIRSSLAAGTSKLDPVPWRPQSDLIEGLTPAEAHARIAELKSVVLGLEFVPEDRRRRGWSDFAYIAELTGQPLPTMESVLEYRRWVNKQAREKGTMLPGMLEFVDTVDWFRDWGLAEIEKEQKAKGTATWEQSVRNHRSAFEKLVSAAGLSSADEASDLFGKEYERTAERALGTLDGTSRKNVERAFTKWRELRAAKLQMDRLPLDLSGSLQILLRSREMTVAVLAKIVGCSAGALNSWVSGLNMPSSGSVAHISKIEDHFLLPKGTLTGKVRQTSNRRFTGSETTDEYKALSWEEKQLLPHDASSWTPSVLKEAIETVRPLLSAGTQQGRLIKIASRPDHLFNPFVRTEALGNQIDEFVTYKTTAVTYPLLRSRKGRWASENTVEMRMDQVETFYRVAAQPRESSGASGFGISSNLQTMAWFAQAPMVLACAGLRASRFQDEDWDGGKRGIFYTGMEEQFLDLAASLTHPETGWLTQQPELRNTLVPIRETIPRQYCDLLGNFVKGDDIPFLSEADVAFAQRDWPAFTKRAHDCYIQAKRHVADVKQVSRNPMLSIAGVFLSGTPMADLLTCVYESEKHWRDARTSPLSHAIDVRDSVMVRLETCLSLRPKNLAGLLYKPDQNGQLRKRDGAWEVEIPFRQFKNWPSTRLFGTKTHRRNFFRRLVDDAELYDMLDYYFFDVINYFPIIEDIVPAAFKTKSGVQMQPHDWNVVAGDFGRQYVAWNPIRNTGIPGVSSLNPYAFRHIRASDILQHSDAYNKVEVAALELQTSETMIVDHYGLLLPDRARISASETQSKASDLALSRIRERLAAA